MGRKSQRQVGGDLSQSLTDSSFDHSVPYRRSWHPLSGATGATGAKGDDSERAEGFTGWATAPKR